MHPFAGDETQREIRVDPDTGEIRVSRWVGVFDVAR